MDADSSVILSCRGVTKRFGALVAVDDVSFEVAPGTSVGIGGPNGAGKTTLFDLITGLAKVSEGEIRFDGASIGGVRPHELCHRGLARTFQLNSGFDGMSVYDNVLAAQAFGRRASGGVLVTRKADHEIVEETLERFGLRSIADSQVADVPILARKKLMVATALVNEPKLLLLDEPVGGLTPSEIDEFIDVMERLKSENFTLVFVEHVMKFLNTVADRAIIMNQGAIIYDGDPAGMSSDATVSEIYLGGAGARHAARP